MTLKIVLSDDDVDKFVKIIVKGIVDGPDWQVSQECQERIKSVIQECLDHPWLDDELRNELIKNIGRVLGISVIGD